MGSVLGMYEGQLKTVSFLPMMNGGAYKQMPYGNLDEGKYDSYASYLQPLDLSKIYAGDAEDAEGEAYCTTDTCIV